MQCCMSQHNVRTCRNQVAKDVRSKRFLTCLHNSIKFLQLSWETTIYFSSIVKVKDGDRSLQDEPSFSDEIILSVQLSYTEIITTMMQYNDCVFGVSIHLISNSYIDILF